MRKLYIWFTLPLLLPAGARAAGSPGWIHGTIPGFEIYTDAPEDALQPQLHDFIAVSRIFDAVWPAPQTSAAAPGVIIFCNDSSEYAELNPGMFTTNVNRNVKSESSHQTSGERPLLMINYDPAAQAQQKEKGVDPRIGYRLQQYYATRLLSLLGERVPPWLHLGLGKLVCGIFCTDDSIEFPALTTDKTLSIREQGSEVNLQASIQGGQFLTLEQLFSETDPKVQRYRTMFGPNSIILWDSSQFPGGRPLGSVAINGSQNAFWVTLPFGTFVDESYELAQYCLFGAGGKYRATFIKFARAASNGPPDEADFKGVFGVDYHEMLLELWRYTAVAKDQVLRLNPSGGGRLPPISPVVFKPATASEIDKVKADYRVAEASDPTGRGTRTPGGPFSD